MANDQGYTHITVTADEEDDVVIQAGSVASAATSWPEATAQTTSEAQSKAETIEPDDVPGNAEAGAQQSAQGNADANYNAPGQQASRADNNSHESDMLENAASEEAREEYLEHQRKREARLAAQEMLTTEEDLHAEVPFAKMQVGIVAVMLLLLAAALVYWFVLR